MQRRCIPVYWRGEHRRVLRGHWYVRKGGLDWLPLREDVAEQLEIAYHKKVIFAAFVEAFGEMGYIWGNLAFDKSVENSGWIYFQWRL